MNSWDSWGFSVDGHGRFRVMFPSQTSRDESAFAFAHLGEAERAGEFAKMVLTTSGIWDGAQQ
jgi:hypothetical protein